MGSAGSGFVSMGTPILPTESCIEVGLDTLVILLYGSRRHDLIKVLKILVREVGV